MQPRIGILVVAYNAAGTLARVLERIPTGFRDRISGILVSDDHSADSTYLVGLGYQQFDPDLPLEVIRNPRNLGYGGNQKVGYRWAIERGRTLADSLPPEVAGTIYLWLAHHAESVEGDPALALELAAAGARSYPQVGELLLIAERLSLATQDRTTAVALYEDLFAAAAGDHGKRALSYRAGRWLERSGHLDEALVHYGRAFELAKTTGVARRHWHGWRQSRQLSRSWQQEPAASSDERSRLTLSRSLHARASTTERSERASAPAQPTRSRRGRLDVYLTDAASRMGAATTRARARAQELTESRRPEPSRCWPSSNDAPAPSASDRARQLVRGVRPADHCCCAPPCYHPISPALRSHRPSS